MLKVMIHKSIAIRGYDFYIYDEDSRGNIRAVKPIEIEPEAKTDIYAYSTPTFRITGYGNVEGIQKDYDIVNSKLISQKDEDKTKHVSSLESIITALIAKGNLK